MSSAVLDRIVRRSGSARLAELAASRDTVKIDLQNVSDYLAQERSRKAATFPLDRDQLGPVMWPWTEALAFWRSDGQGTEFLADYVAFVRADHEHRCYDGLLFRLLPHASDVAFMGWGGVRCLADGRAEFQASPECLSDAHLQNYVEVAFHILGRWPIDPRDRINAARQLRAAVAAGTYLTTVLLFAARFANCRNVVQVEKSSADTTPKPWLRAGHPRYTYRTLAIDPGALRVRKNDTLPSGRHGVSLHICRGHFATYTDDRPLFGKYTGTFWVPQHTRGDPGLGFVEKSYAVGTPAAPAGAVT